MHLRPLLLVSLAFLGAGCVVTPNGSAVLLPPVPTVVVGGPTYGYGYRSYYRPYYRPYYYGSRYYAPRYYGGYRGGYYNRGYYNRGYYNRGYAGGWYRGRR